MLKALDLKISSLQSRDFLWYWLPPLAWCGVIVVVSGDLGSSENTWGILEWLLSWFPPLSPAQFKLMHFYVRKTIGHFGNYAFLYFLWFRAFRGNLGYARGGPSSWSLALCLVMALLDEGHQAMFATRSSSLKDVALDLSRGRDRGPGYLGLSGLLGSGRGREIIS